MKDLPSTSRCKESCCGNKHATLRNIMRHGKNNQAECSLYDLDIEM